MWACDEHRLRLWLAIYAAVSKSVFPKSFWIASGGHPSNFFEVENFSFDLDRDLDGGVQL